MSSYERWRGFRIVEEQNIAKEESPNLVGGLTNALERGATLEKAKQSFINAGYKPEEVEIASQKVSGITPKIVSPGIASIKGLNPVVSKKKVIPNTATSPPKKKKQISKKFTIALILLSVIVVAGLAFIGISWFNTL